MLAANDYNKRIIITFLVPLFFVFLTLLLFPLLYNIVLSFYQKNTLSPDLNFIGLDNYRLLIKDHEFLISFKNGIYYAFYSVIIQLFIGVTIAVFLSKDSTLNRVLSGLFIMPYLLPTVLGIMLWKWLLNSDYGIISLTINKMINTNFNWFSNKSMMSSLILISIWQFTPFVILFILARIRTIKKEYYNSASIDNVSGWYQFTKITLPQLKYVLLTVTLIRVIWMFTKFDTVWILVGNGASRLTVQNLPVLAFRQTFSYFQQGLGAACSVVLLLCILFISASFYKRFIAI